MSVQVVYELHARFSCVFSVLLGMVKPHLDGSVAHRAFSITILNHGYFLALLGIVQVMQIVPLPLQFCTQLACSQFAPVASFRNMDAGLMQQGR